ncbi:MAG TPA: head GIN domain-containing protein [Puia sp.]|nr:head GIN domain-containing protein [Puia sp.]
MKRIIFFLAGCLSLVSVLAQKTIINDPNVEVRAVKGFHGIEVSNAIDLYLSQGDQETVAVSAAEIKWRDRIRTEVDGGILKIWLDTKGWSWNGGHKKMKAYISFTTLDKLVASGASDVYVDGVISGSSLDIRLSGASDFKGAIKVNELRLDQSGASDAHITGTVDGLTTIQSSGASDVKGYDLVTGSCNAHLSGASDIRITVNKELNVSASGASSLYYKGDAVIREMHSSGASSVSKKS